VRILSIDVVDGISSTDPIELHVDPSDDGEWLTLEAERLGVRLLSAESCVDWKGGSWWRRTPTPNGNDGYDLVSERVSDEKAAQIVSSRLRSDSQHEPFIEEEAILDALSSEKMRRLELLLAVMES